MSEKTILCAIDFSKSSTKALKWTLGMAQFTRARIIVLFCYRLIPANDDEETQGLKRTMEQVALKKFKEIEKGLIHDTSVSVQFVTEVGFFPFRIEMFLRKNPVGLLVIGNSIIQSFNEFKNLSFEEFLKTTKIPVVIVPEEARNFIKPAEIIEFPLQNELI
jgi:hypothetical protein